MEQNNSLKKALKKIESIMREQSVKKLTIHRKYLPEIFNAELLQLYEGLPIIKPYVENQFRLNGILIKISNKEIRFKQVESDSFEDVLKDLLLSLPEAKAATIVSAEGLPIASVLSSGIDETRIAAMNATLLSLAKHSLKEMKKGEFEQLYIRGSDGYLLLLQAGPNAILCVSTTKDVRLGLIFLDCQQACKRLSSDFSEDEDAYEYKQFYCKHCGSRLPEGQSICQVCGKKVD